METFQTKSAAGTVSLGERIARRWDRGDCIALCGPLGAGKTVLVRGMAAGLGVADTRIVSSPSFVLVHEYDGRLPIYHVDLYRVLAPAAELIDLGFDEMLAEGVVLIEWADRAEEALPLPRWQIDIEITGRRSRHFTLRRIE